MQKGAVRKDFSLRQIPVARQHHRCAVVARGSRNQDFIPRAQVFAAQPGRFQKADAAGIDVAKTRFIAVMVSGALSGLAGMCFAYSISAKFSSGIYVGYGYLSIAALIFGNWKIIPTLAACLLFGFAKSGGYQIVQAAGLPSSYSDLIMILPYVLTLLLLVFFSKHNDAPKALGEIYDKGKR